jgi:hypothetical protein
MSLRTSLLFCGVLGCASDDGPKATIWAIDPPDATPERAMRIANALGLSNVAIVERGDAVLAIPTALRALPTTLRATGSLAIGKLRLDAGEIVLGGRLEADGAFVASTFAAPNLVAATAGGQITGVLAVASGANARASLALGLHPSDPDAVGLDLPLELAVQCSGSDCFRGTCTIPIAIAPALETDSYRRANGRAHITTAIAPAPISTWQCSADSDPARTAQLLGIAAGGQLDVDVAFTPVPERDAAPVVIDRATGFVSYRPDALATVPPEAEAREAADRLLAASDIVPANARVRVMEGDDHTSVLYEPMLPIDETGELVPVRDASVLVRVSTGGRIVGLEARWRPVRASTLATLRPEDDAREARDAIADEWETPALRDVNIERAYTPVGPGVTPAYYDLVWRVPLPPREHGTARHATGPGDDLVLTAASKFQPLLAELELPDDIGAVDATRPVAMRLAVEAGTPPYTVRWTSDLDGDLGTGEGVAPMLRAGRHEIRVSIADSVGAGFTFLLPMQVVGPREQEALPRHTARARETIMRGQTRRFGFGGGYEASITAERHEHAPLVSVAMPHNKVGLESLQMQRWRYAMEVKIGNQAYQIRSGMCLGLGILGACYSPNKPLAEFTAETPGDIVAEVADDKIDFAKTWGVKNLPGNLELTAHYAFGKYYCGPSFSEQPWYKRAGGKVYVGIRKSELLGGECTGVRPEILWKYDPPAGGMTPKQLKDFCLDPRTNMINTDADGQPICNIPLDTLRNVERLCDSVPIEKFTMFMYTLARPHKRGEPMKTTLVKDKDGAEAGLATTDGTINRSNQPWFVPNEAFVDIRGIASERTANFVSDGRPGEWDNFHAKHGIRDVTFPGCNDRRDVNDNSPCFHFHERWPDEKVSIDGRDEKAGGRGGKTKLSVNLYIVRDRDDDAFPVGDPTKTVNNEKLLDGLFGLDDMVWLIGKDGPYPDGVAQDGKRLSGGYLHAPVFFTF